MLDVTPGSGQDRRATINKGSRGKVMCVMCVHTCSLKPGALGDSCQGVEPPGFRLGVFGLSDAVQFGCGSNQRSDLALGPGIKAGRGIERKATREPERGPATDAGKLS